MSVAGLCSICEASPARHTCERCGALVCDDHYVPSLGLCTECARIVRAGDRSPE
ncbi:MAG: hypothetical protein ACOC42_04140 [Halobacteriota archaeon]